MKFDMPLNKNNKTKLLRTMDIFHSAVNFANMTSIYKNFALSAGVVEYTDCTSAKV